MKRIAIQGLIGSFHDIAAHLYFEGEQIQLICCSTFEEVFAEMKKDHKLSQFSDDFCRKKTRHRNAS